MFRRQTDQVYATLQQVQRRITEQAPGQSAVPPADRSASVPPFGPLQEALQRQKAPQQLVGHQPEAPPPPTQLPVAPRGGISITISLQLAITLLVLMLIACALCFQAGSMAADRRSQHAPAEYAAGEAGNRQPQSAVPPLGPDLLVLTQVPTSTPELEQQYRKRAAELNAIMEKNAARGWKPWFGLRHPINGGLQLVFGEVADDQFGIMRKDFEDFARMLAQPPPNGGGYASAAWLKVK